MGTLVTMGAMMACSFGATPSALVVVPTGTPIIAGATPPATIMDFKPMVNIPPFGICNAPTNPAVIAAKAIGATAPCVPIIPAPWVPGSPTVLINNVPALNEASKCMCTWAGVISITFPGQVLIQVP
jgi:Domain of unknown function (DUF4280)